MAQIKVNISCTVDHLIKALYYNMPTDEFPKENKCWIAIAVQDIMPKGVVFITGIFADSQARNPISLPKFVLERMDFFDAATVKERMSMKPFAFDATLNSSIVEEILKANEWVMKDLFKAIRESDTISFQESTTLIEA